MWTVQWTSASTGQTVARKYATYYHAEQFARALQLNGCAGVLVVPPANTWGAAVLAAGPL